MYEQARAIFRAHGFLGYRNEWVASDFPIGDFLRLHDVLSGEPLCRRSVAEELTLLAETLK